MVCVHAVDERAARTRISDACQAWIEHVGASRTFRVSPWEDPHFVTCVEVDESGQVVDTAAAIRWPAPANEAG